MSISNIRAHEAEASIHPREGLSTHCRGKEVNCALHRLWEGRGQATPTLPLKPLESLSNSCWNKTCHSFFSLVSFFLQHLLKSHLVLRVQLTCPHLHLSFPASQCFLWPSFPLCLWHLIAHNLIRIFNSCLPSAISTLFPQLEEKLKVGGDYFIVCFLIFPQGLLES